MQTPWKKEGASLDATRQRSHNFDASGGGMRTSAEVLLALRRCNDRYFAFRFWSATTALRGNKFTEMKRR